MNAKTPRQRRAARRERIAKRQEELAAAEAAMAAYPGARWVTKNELYKHVCILRKQNHLPPLKNANSMGGMLEKKQVPFYRYGSAMRNKKYLWSFALRALVHLNARVREPWCRVGTKEEVLRGDAMPLSEAASAFRCNTKRLTKAIHNLDLFAFRHPITGAVWVHKEQARDVAEYRTAHFIRRMLPPNQANYLISTRPSRCRQGTKTYWVPELSHLGSKNTAYIPKYSNI